VGGTAKTPLSIKVYEILKNLNFKSATIKKFYTDQIDEQKLLDEKTNLYCFSTRNKALNEAIKDNINVAIFDDGLQDRSINYDLRFVCFNNITWIGNGFLMPSGPLREKIESISKYDAVFLNGNEEDNSKLKLLIKKYNDNIQIFESFYRPININKLDKDNKYLIFSGIGNPENFRRMLDKNKVNIAKELKFPDHYKYENEDIKKIKSHAKELNAKILTTKKDYVKLNNDPEIQFLDIELIIKEETKLINFVKSYL
jgi:tetraacyldisaccharide 4'-kinase